MSNLQFSPIPSDATVSYQQGALDYNDQAPEKSVTVETGYPCRHCLDGINEGDDMLLLSYRPFDALQPYAEQGPIVLHAHGCKAWENNGKLPSIITVRETIIIRGYDNDDRIVGNTGQVISTVNFEQECSDTFENEDVSYIHVRSASNNCYFCRVERGENSLPS